MVIWELMVVEGGIQLIMMYDGIIVFGEFIGYDKGWDEYLMCLWMMFSQVGSGIGVYCYRFRCGCFLVC